jgi:hypothetical protein
MQVSPKFQVACISCSFIQTSTSNWSTRTVHLPQGLSETTRAG